MLAGTCATSLTSLFGRVLCACVSQRGWGITLLGVFCACRARAAVRDCADRCIAPMGALRVSQLRCMPRWVEYSFVAGVRDLLDLVGCVGSCRSVATLALWWIRGLTV